MGYHFSVKWFNYISNSNISNSSWALQLLLERLLPWLFMNFFVCRLSLYNYVHIVYVHKCEIRSPYLHTCYKNMAFDFFNVSKPMSFWVLHMLYHQNNVIWLFFLCISDKAQSTSVTYRVGLAAHSTIKIFHVLGSGSWQQIFNLSYNWFRDEDDLQRLITLILLKSGDPQFIWGGFKPQIIFLCSGKI